MLPSVTTVSSIFWREMSELSISGWVTQEGERFETNGPNPVHRWKKTIQGLKKFIMGDEVREDEVRDRPEEPK